MADDQHRDGKGRFARHQANSEFNDAIRMAARAKYIPPPAPEGEVAGVRGGSEPPLQPESRGFGGGPQPGPPPAKQNPHGHEDVNEALRAAYHRKRYGGVEDDDGVRLVQLANRRLGGQ